MPVTSVEKRLRSIGFSIFIKHYEEFKDKNYDTNILAKKLLMKNNKATSFGAQKTRISNARKIFAENQQIDALRTIIESERVEDIIIDKAKELLKLERGLA